jgi:hypothetical protein
VYGMAANGVDAITHVGVVWVRPNSVDPTQD